jgi:hypothetical protein
MCPPPRERRAPYTACKVASRTEPLSSVALNAAQRAAIAAALADGGDLESMDLTIASCEALYISNTRVHTGAFVDIACRVDGLIALRGLAHVTAIRSIALRATKRKSVATLIDLQLMQTHNPFPMSAAEPDVSSNRFGATSTKLAICLTHQRGARNIEVQSTVIVCCLLTAPADCKLGRCRTCCQSIRSVPARTCKLDECSRARVPDDDIAVRCETTPSTLELSTSNRCRFCENSNKKPPRTTTSEMRRARARA